jgi:hypothetical protein
MEITERRHEINEEIQWMFEKWSLWKVYYLNEIFFDWIEPR